MKTFLNPLLIIGILSLALPVAGQNKQDSTKVEATKPLTKPSPAAKDRNACERSVPSCVDCCDGDIQYLYDMKCKAWFTLENGTFRRMRSLRGRSVRYKEEVRFKIINVNRYNYNINFASEDIEFTSEPPPIFNTFFLGNGSLSIPEVNDTSSEKGGFKDNKTLAEFIKDLKAFQNIYYGLIDRQIEVYGLCGKIACSCSDQQVTLSSLNQALEDLTLSYQKTKTALEKEIKQHEDSVVSFEAKVAKGANDLATLQGELRKLESAKPQNKTQINQKKQRIEEVTDSLDFNKEIRNDYKLKVKTTTSTKSDLEELWKSIKLPTRDQLLQLVLFNNNIAQEHYEYVAPAIFPLGHRLQVGFKITPRDTSSLITRYASMPLTSDTVSITFPVIFKPFVSFSSGLFYAGGKNLRETEYDWQPQANASGVVPDTAQFKIVSSGEVTSHIGFAALANAAVKLAPSFAFGVAIGAGLSIEDDPRPAYLGGISLMFGEEKQFTINFGLAAMRVKTLKLNSYPNIETTLFGEEKDLKYSKSLERGGFIAITYTPFSLSGRKNNGTSK